MNAMKGDMKGDAPSSGPGSRRIRYLDFCRGLTIILMVAGHYMPAQAPETWKTINVLFHALRMPTFYFLSGYLFFIELTRNRDAAIGPLIKKKAARLLIPCVCIGAVYIAIKLILPHFMPIGDPLTKDTLLNFVRHPVKSFVPVIWFLQALFIIFVLFLLLRVKLGVDPHLIFAVCVVLTYFDYPLYFAFDGAVKNMQFFVLGYLVNLHLLDKRIDRKFLFAAVPIFAVNAFFFVANPGSVTLKLIAAYSGLVSLVFVAMLLSKSNRLIPRLIEQAGILSMGIYIMHPYIVGAMAVLFYRGEHKLPPNLFVLGLAAAVLLAVVTSACVEKYILRRHALTRKLILGMSR